MADDLPRELVEVVVERLDGVLAGVDSASASLLLSRTGR